MLEQQTDEQSMNDMLSEELNKTELVELGSLAKDLVIASMEKSVADKRQKTIKKRIMEILDACGLDGATAGGRSLGFSTRTFWGVAEGATPEDHAAHIDMLRQWLGRVAPEMDVPASTNINKAVAAFEEEGGDPASLPFLRKSETRSLTNRKAK